MNVNGTLVLGGKVAVIEVVDALKKWQVTTLIDKTEGGLRQG